jgi:ankyrin repeat protein
MALTCVIALLPGCGGSNMQAKEFFTPEMVQLLSLIQKGKKNEAADYIQAHSLDLNTHGDKDITPLLWLVIQQEDKIATKLALELGADPNFERANGENAVTMIAGSNDPELLIMMLDAGGDPNSLDRNGMPALFEAISQESWADINTLIKYGADVNLTNKSGLNAALYAPDIAKYEYSWFFIQQGADPLIHDATGGDLAWSVHDDLTRGIVKPENRNYPWLMKIKEHLIGLGVTFPPPSPREVRAKRNAEEDKAKADK